MYPWGINKFWKNTVFSISLPSKLGLKLIWYQIYLRKYCTYIDVIELLFSLFQIEVIQDSQEKKNSDHSPGLDNNLDILKKYYFFFNLRSYVHHFIGDSGSVPSAHVFELCFQNRVLVRTLKEQQQGVTHPVFRFEQLWSVSGVEDFYLVVLGIVRQVLCC